MIHPKVVEELADRLFGSTTAQAVVVLDVDRRAEDRGNVGDERKEPPQRIADRRCDAAAGAKGAGEGWAGARIGGVSGVLPHMVV
ncbi:MAG: hypothetical protein ACYDEY_07735 [Acidimicrobiales bacterium]